jgi:hypothetical protein
LNLLISLMFNVPRFAAIRSARSNRGWSRRLAESVIRIPV